MIAPIIEKRASSDRRSRRISGIRYLLLGGRRSQIRRKGDKQQTMLLDNYSASLLTAALLILVLSIVDGLLTLYLLGEGATELNPIMNYFILSF